LEHQTRQICTECIVVAPDYRSIEEFRLQHILLPGTAYSLARSSLKLLSAPAGSHVYSTSLNLAVDVCDANMLHHRYSDSLVHKPDNNEGMHLHPLALQLEKGNAGRNSQIPFGEMLFSSRLVEEIVHTVGPWYAAI
jgi:hypothetical protein